MTLVVDNVPKHFMTERPAKGRKYYALVTWTANGERPEQCIWRGDLIDNDRFRKCNVFETKQAASAAQKEKEIA